MNLTTLFRLRKPEGTDPVDVKDFNDNFDVIDAELGKRLEKTGNGSDLVTAFSQAGSRANLTSGERLSLSFGKIMKWFADLKAVAFSGNYNDLANKPSIPGGAAANYAVADNDLTNNSGYLATARVAYEHGREIDQISSDLASARQSFQAGCSTIAAAITAMGVATASNASPATMAANIRSIVMSASGSFVSSMTTVQTLHCGFRPNKVVVLNTNTGRGDVVVYDGRIYNGNVLLCGYHNSQIRRYTFDGWSLDDNGNKETFFDTFHFSITDDGFQYRRYVAYDGDTMVWFASK